MVPKGVKPLNKTLIYDLAHSYIMEQNVAKWLGKIMEGGFKDFRYRCDNKNRRTAICERICGAIEMAYYLDHIDDNEFDGLSDGMIDIEYAHLVKE